MEPVNDSPWHSGERVLQHSVGVAERMEVFDRKVIRNYMPDQHRSFYAQQPFLVVAAVDSLGAPWVPPGLRLSRHAQGWPSPVTPKPCRSTGCRRQVTRSVLRWPWGKALACWGLSCPRAGATGSMGTSSRVPLIA